MPATVAARGPAGEPKLLTLHDVCRRVRLGHSKIYELIKTGDFPKPIKIGRVARWVPRRVDQWVEDQIAASER
jgi:predicted DNA-binding transcriptional regulator AlpA